MCIRDRKKRYQGDQIYVREPAEIDIDSTYRRTHQPEEILLAYSVIAERSRKKAAYEKTPVSPPVEKSYVTVFTGIFTILKNLRRNASIEMKTLFEGQPRSRKVATFLAVLELSKDGRIVISEDGSSVRLTTPEERARVMNGRSVEASGTADNLSDNEGE